MTNKNKPVVHYRESGQERTACGVHYMDVPEDASNYSSWYAMGMNMHGDSCPDCIAEMPIDIKRTLYSDRAFSEAPQWWREWVDGQKHSGYILQFYDDYLKEWLDWECDLNNPPTPDERHRVTDRKREMCRAAVRRGDKLQCTLTEKDAEIEALKSKLSAASEADSHMQAHYNTEVETLKKRVAELEAVQNQILDSAKRVATCTDAKRYVDGIQIAVDIINQRKRFSNETLTR